MVCASREKTDKIAGGFVLVPVVKLLHAWQACRKAPLRTADFRAWLACHEMMARRCHVHRDRDRSPRFGVAELAKLAGSSERRARASVRRLVGAGLIEWSDEAVTFPDLLDGNLEQPLDAIGGGQGSLAIPRRMLRFLANGATAAMIATVAGLLLRCLSRRKDGWDGRGRCKASWLARTFGMGLRQIKAARRELLDLGWIVAEPGDQWAENRWGRAFTIDFAWEAPDSGVKGARQASFTGSGKGECITPFPGANSAPLPAIPGANSAPPDLHQEPSLSGGSSNQEPARGPTGFSISRPGGEDTAPATQRDRPPVMLSNAQASPGLCSGATDLPAPKLADVRIEDLKDTARLLDLYRQAMARGLVGAAEADRLRFIAAAEHALAIASNPAALFAWLVLRGCWRYASQAAEDRANARIKGHRRGPDLTPIASSPRACTSSRPVATPGPPRVQVRCLPSAPPGPVEPGGLSEDARTVKAMREASIRAGIYRDPWPAFQSLYPAWDRVRWDRALIELGLA